MKKFLLSVIAIVAMSVNALAQEIHVPDELNGWYAGYYVVTNIDLETLKSGVHSFCNFDGLGGNTWTESQQASIERTCHWGEEDDPISYFGQISGGKFFVGGNSATLNYYAFFFVNGPRMSAGTSWRIYLAPQRGPCTLTNADLYLQGIFGQGFTEPTGINSIEADQDAGMPVKMIENGQLVIKRNGVKYNLQGQVIE